MSTNNSYEEVINSFSSATDGLGPTAIAKKMSDLGKAYAKAIANGDRATAKYLINSVYGAASMNNTSVFLIRVIYNDPATIAFWSDGTKTIVKAQPGDIFDPEKGLAMAIAKKACDNTGNYYNSFKKWLPKEPVGNEEIIYKAEKHEDTVEEDEYYE